MRTRSNFGVIGQIQPTTNSSTGIVLTSADSLGVKGITVSGAGVLVCEVMLIGGGGAGTSSGGGGGEVATTSFILIKGTTYTFTIGAGGASSGGGGAGTGSFPGFKTTMSGGGINFRALYGGCGGAIGDTQHRYSSGFNAGGSSYSNGPTTASQDDIRPVAVGGNFGGYMTPNISLYPGSGGGGSWLPGGDASGYNGGSGGDGLPINWLGPGSFYGAGGGGGAANTSYTPGTGGRNGGGNGGYNQSVPSGNDRTGGANAWANSGGGGGGGTTYTGGVGQGAGKGGSGAAMVRFLETSYTGTPTTTGSPTKNTYDGYTIYVFNSTGTITF